MSVASTLSPRLLDRYNRRSPRYTSYPTALQFESFEHTDLLSERPICVEETALYIHIPFCRDLCYYCGCNKVIARDSSKADVYLDYLEREMHLRSVLLHRTSIAQVHVGGGSPGFLTVAQHARLRTMIETHFGVAPGCEFSIELDPRHTTQGHLAWLSELGYQRLSLGLQDTNSKVQQAINRTQSTVHLAHLVEMSRKLGITSVNLDVIYGLPHQNLNSFEQTLADVVSMQPDRISLFGYAHLPARFAAQRKIHPAWLPDGQLRLSLVERAQQRFAKAGYCQIGMDHFALPDDPLAVAQQQQRLHRNFQGYTTGEQHTVIGFGVSAISATEWVYSQNPSSLKAYYQRLDASTQLRCNLTDKGYRLSADDQIRRYVIMQLMCNLNISFARLYHWFGVQFKDYFAKELINLSPLIQDDLIKVSSTDLEVLEVARPLIRTVCSFFDAYHEAVPADIAYSQVV